MPVGFGVALVAVVLPCGDFAGEDLLVGDVAIQTLRGENAEFGFGQIEPTAVLGRIVPFEALDEPARLGRGKTKCSRACSPATLPDFRQGPSRPSHSN